MQGSHPIEYMLVSYISTKAGFIRIILSTNKYLYDLVTP